MSAGPSTDSAPSGAHEQPGAIAASVKEHEAGGAAGGVPGVHHAGIAALTLGALGVVFGDIGTSPLYALQTVLHADHGAVPTTSPPSSAFSRSSSRRSRSSSRSST
jgi:hypothetical protein